MSLRSGRLAEQLLERCHGIGKLGRTLHVEQLRDVASQRFGRRVGRFRIAQPAFDVGCAADTPRPAMITCRSGSSVR